MAYSRPGAGTSARARHQNADSGTYRYKARDSHQDTHTDADCYTFANAYKDTYKDANQNANEDTDSHPNTIKQKTADF